MGESLTCVEVDKDRLRNEFLAMDLRSSREGNSLLEADFPCSIVQANVRSFVERSQEHNSHTIIQYSLIFLFSNCIECIKNTIC